MRRSRAGQWTIDRNLLALFCQSHRATRLGLSVREAAIKSGTSAAAISRIENRHRTEPETMLAVCRWMGANPFWFLLGADGKRPIPAPDVEMWTRQDREGPKENNPVPRETIGETV